MNQTMQRIALCGLSVVLLAGAVCLSGCGENKAKTEADEAAKWHSGGPSQSYADEVNAKRAAAAKPGPPAGAATAARQALICFAYDFSRL